MVASSLAGRRVLVTRAAHQAGKLSEGLRALGVEPVEVAVIEIRPPSDFAPLDRELRSLSSYDWLILTSANTVQALADRAAALGLSLAAAPRLQVAAVGEATATAARSVGLRVALVPKSYVAENLIDELLRQSHQKSAHSYEGSSAALSKKHEVSGQDFSRAENGEEKHGALAPEGNADVLKGHGFSRANQLEKEPGALQAAEKLQMEGERAKFGGCKTIDQPSRIVPGASWRDSFFTLFGKLSFSAACLAPEGNLRGQRFLIARASVARDVIPDALRAAGASVDVVDAYRNVMPRAAPALLREALQKGIAAAAFTSSSTVTHLADAAQKAGIAFPFAGVAAISIGPITSQTLRDLGWERTAEATQSDVTGLIQAIARALG